MMILSETSFPENSSDSSSGSSDSGSSDSGDTDERILAVVEEIKCYDTY